MTDPQITELWSLWIEWADRGYENSYPAYELMACCRTMFELPNLLLDLEESRDMNAIIEKLCGILEG